MSAERSPRSRAKRRLALAAAALLALSLTPAPGFADADDAGAALGICGATIQEGKKKLDEVAQKLEALKKQLQQPPAPAAANPPPSPTPGTPPTPESRLVAGAETELNNSRSYVAAAEKAYQAAQDALARHDDTAARAAMTEVVENVGRADHVSASLSGTIDMVGHFATAHHFNGDGFLDELRRVAATSQAAYVYTGREGGEVLAKSLAADAFGGGSPAPLPVVPATPAQGTDFFHARGPSRPVGGIKLTLGDLSIASVDPVKKELLLVGKKGTGEKGEGEIDGDLFWTALRLAAQSDSFEPDFSIDPVDPRHWELQWKHLSLYLSRTLTFDDAFFATGSTRSFWDGKEYKFTTLERADPALAKRIDDEFRIQELLRFEPAWLRSTRLGEVLFRADLAIKELWKPVSVTGEPASRVEKIPGVVRFATGGEEGGPTAYRFWFVPGSRAAAGDHIIDLSQVQPMLKVVATSGGRDVDTQLPPWTKAMRDDVNKRFDLYARAIPEWAQLRQVFRAYVFGVWLRRTDPASFAALMARAPEPEPPSKPLPQLLEPYIFVAYHSERDGNVIHSSSLAEKGGIGFSPRDLAQAPVEGKAAAAMREEASAASRDAAAARPGQQVAATLALGAPQDAAPKIDFAVPIRSLGVLESTLDERFARFRDTLGSRVAPAAPGLAQSLALAAIGALLVGMLGVKRRRRARAASARPCAYCTRTAELIGADGIPSCARCRRLHRAIEYGAALVGGGFVALAVIDDTTRFVPGFAATALVILLAAAALRALRLPLPRDIARAALHRLRRAFGKAAPAAARPAASRPIGMRDVVDLVGLASLVLALANAPALTQRFESAWSGPHLIAGNTVDDQALFQLIATVQGLMPLPHADLIGDTAGIALIAALIWLAYRIAAGVALLAFGIRREERPRLASGTV